MLSREIRLGNWLKYPNTNPFQVSAVYLQSHNFWEDIDDNIEPVPLTEEWLLRLGFTKDTYTGFGGKLHTYFRMDKFKEVLPHRRCFEIDFWAESNTGTPFMLRYYDFGVMIYSVHQLQNIFFELIRKEL